jgi:soluble lytic murein transglycosylase-like protein
MHRFAVAALVLLCASSVSGLSLTPTGRVLGTPMSARAGTRGLPLVPAAPPTLSKQNAETAAQTLPATPQLRPATAEVLAHFEGRHTLLSERDLVSLAETIVDEAERHGLDPSLVLAVIEVESGYHSQAVSHVGALGLMQLMPATGRELARKHDVEWRGEESLFDPIVNVKLGTAYLRELTDRYDSTPTALAAYNWGPGRIDSRLRRGATVPSRYIEQVMKVYDRDEPRQAGRS